MLNSKLSSTKNNEKKTGYFIGKVTKNGLKAHDSDRGKMVTFSISVSSTEFEVKNAEYVLDMKDVSLKRGGDNAKYPMMFVSVVAYDQTAERFEKAVKAGDIIAVVGTISDHEYNNEHSISVVAANFVKLKEYKDANLVVTSLAEDLKAAGVTGKLTKNSLTTGTSKSGKSFTKFNLAMNVSKYDVDNLDRVMGVKTERNGNNADYPTVYLPVVAFGRTGERAAKFLKEGDMVSVIGTLSVNEYKDKKTVNVTLGDFTKVFVKDSGTSASQNKPFTPEIEPDIDDDDPFAGIEGL